MERLDKLLTSTGRWSRSEAKRLVKEGRVLVNGHMAASPEEKYDPETVSLAVNGEAVPLRRFVYVMLHKPAGVLSATEDGRGKTVLELLPPEYRKRGLFPVGRLDKDTEGLLLLTDDGALAHELLSPKKHVDKVYYARVEGELTEADSRAFAEGKFHQIKRMLAARGKPVVYLKRLSMGTLRLDETLPKGGWRELTEGETVALRFG